MSSRRPSSDTLSRICSSLISDSSFSRSGPSPTITNFVDGKVNQNACCRLKKDVYALLRAKPSNEPDDLENDCCEELSPNEGGALWKGRKSMPFRTIWTFSSRTPAFSSRLPHLFRDRDYRGVTPQQEAIRHTVKSGDGQIVVDTRCGRWRRVEWPLGVMRSRSICQLCNHARGRYPRWCERQAIGCLRVRCGRSAPCRRLDASRYPA